MPFFRLILCLTMLLLPLSARAEEPAHPLLEQMSRESQALYEQLRAGVVRLQLPPPKWLGEAAADDNPVDKWAPQLNATVKEKLDRERRSARQGKYNAVNARIVPTTQPGATAPSPWIVAPQEAGDNTVVVHSTGDGASIQIQTGGDLKDGRVTPGGAPKLTLLPSAGFAPNNVGLIFDDAGHLLVPLYLEKETVGDGVPASVGGGPVVTATFVASDRQTNLTVLQLPAKTGKPVKLGASPPADGSLVMLLAPNSASARLVLWTGGQRDVAGLVAGVDGSVCGFARYGQFLRASACKPVVEQLVLTGRVKRATLGVLVREVPADDPLRDRADDRGAGEPLGNRPALRVEEVAPRSAAAGAGLRVGDLILSVAGDPVGDPAGFAVAISNRSGDTPVRVLRQGKVVEVSVDLKVE